MLRQFEHDITRYIMLESSKMSHNILSNIVNDIFCLNGLSRLLTCYITFYQTFEHLTARKYDIEFDSLKILIHITLNSYS